jgi:hypothetical protein
MSHTDLVQWGELQERVNGAKLLARVVKSEKPVDVTHSVFCTTYVLLFTYCSSRSSFFADKYAFREVAVADLSLFPTDTGDGIQTMQ